MVLYKEFKVGDLFRLKSIRQIPRGFVPELKEEGEYPYLTQKTGGSYGVNGYMDETDELELVEEPMIVTGVDNVAKGVMYWWDKPFYANKMLGLINENLNRERAQYIITVLLKMYMGFDYNNKINMKIVRETVIQLPVKTLEDNEPDWEYMEDYIKQKELAYIGKINKEFEQKKEQLIELIGEESEYINIDDLPTAKFKVGDLFDGYIGKFVSPNNRSEVETEEYNIPLITSQTTNNGIQSYVREGEYEMLEDCLSISKDGVHAGTVFYQEGKFSLGNVAMGIYAKEKYKENISRLVYIYTATLLEKIAKSFGGYDKKVGWNLFEYDLELPVNPEVSDLEPDWETMEDYVNGIKHLYLHKEESKHKEKLELLYELTGWTEEDLENIGDNS